jgi:hypothetical protein
MSSKRTSVRMANGSAAANGVTPSYLLTDKVALVTGSGTFSPLSSIFRYSARSPLHHPFPSNP